MRRTTSTFSHFFSKFFSRFFVGFIAGSASLAQLACNEASSARPNLVLITLDTLRADRLGSYGYPGASTPALDAIAQRGVRFRDAIAQATTTPPSHASILTGQNPARHGLRRLYGQRLPDANQTLAEILHAEGYATAAFVSALPLRRGVGLDQGFEVYDDSWEAANGKDRHYRPARETNARVFEWLATPPSEPFFLWIHYFDAHHPYFPPQEFRDRFGVGQAVRGHLPIARNTNRRRRDGSAVQPPRPPVVNRMSRLYDAEISYLDTAIGELLDRLEETELLDGSVIAFVADHGEHLGENGYYFGHWDVLDETARVPMAIAHADGRNAGRVVPQSVGTIDLVPTLLAWLDVDVDIDFDGRDLTPLIEGDSAEERPVSTEQFEYFPVRAVRSGPWMLRQAAEPKQSVEDGVISLSRRTQHGGGKRDTIPPEIERRLAEALEESARPSVYHEIERIQIPEPVRAQLRALGYTDEARGPGR